MAQPPPPAREPGSNQRGNQGPDTNPSPRGGAGRVGSASASSPFAWQHGRRLFLLEPEPLGWVLAELRFDEVTCRYVELRRARYRWAREAAGALLSRALAAGDAATTHLAGDLASWVSVNHGSW